MLLTRNLCRNDYPVVGGCAPVVVHGMYPGPRRLIRLHPGDTPLDSPVTVFAVVLVPLRRLTRPHTTGGSPPRRMPRRWGRRWGHGGDSSDNRTAPAGGLPGRFR